MGRCPDCLWWWPWWCGLCGFCSCCAPPAAGPSWLSMLPTPKRASVSLSTAPIPAPGAPAGGRPLVEAAAAGRGLGGWGCCAAADPSSPSSPCWSIFSAGLPAWAQVRRAGRFSSKTPAGPTAAHMGWARAGHASEERPCKQHPVARLSQRAPAPQPLLSSPCPVQRSAAQRGVAHL